MTSILDGGRLRRVNVLAIIVEVGDRLPDTADGALCDVGVVARGAVVSIWQDRTRHSVRSGIPRKL